MTRRELRFIQPSTEAFRQVLPAPSSGQSVMLIGQGKLAEAWAKEANTAGLSVDRRLEVPSPETVNSRQLLCLAEIEGDALGAMLIACVDMMDVQILAPVTDRHISRNPLYIVSIPKAGTHLVYELARALGYADGIEQPAFPRAQTWYCVEYSNSHTVARDFFVDTVRRKPFGNRHHAFAHSPVLFIYRHPLDILVSEAHYYHRDGKSVFSGYFAGEDFDQRIQRLANDEWLLGSLRTRLGGFLPWLCFPNVIPISFEELVGEAGGGQAEAQQRLIWSIQLKLQAEGIPEQIALRIFNRNAATFREGKIGGYRSQLSPELIETLMEQCGDIVASFGYPTNTDAMIPLPAAGYATRPLRYSVETFDEMPINVEADFLGCNLVRYAQRFYAVPLSAGSVALERLMPEVRQRLPSAANLSELKSILLIGRKNHDRQVAMLAAVGQTLQSDEPSKLESYWQWTAAPRIIDTLKGFNLVAWNGRYFALRQSLGPVDLTEELPVLLQRYSRDDLWVANDLDSLRDEIYGVASFVRKTERLSTRLDAIESQIHNQQRLAADNPPVSQNDLEKERTDILQFFRTEIELRDQAWEKERADILQFFRTEIELRDQAWEKERADTQLFLLREVELRDQALEVCLRNLEANWMVRFGGFINRIFSRRKQ